MCCCCLDWVPPAPRVQQTILSASDLAGIIGAAAALLAVLLVLFIVLIFVLARRRRKRLSKSKYKSSAHDNPTYMTHRDLNANLAASGSPVDLMFDADGAFGAAFYADDEKKKVLESIVRENV